MRIVLAVAALAWLTPSLAAAQYVPTGRPARIRFVADDPAVTFHVPVGALSGVAWSGRGAFAWRQQAYQPVCIAPCERLLPEDTYRFALSLEGGAEIAARGVLELRDGMTVLGHYVDESASRTAGAVITTLTGLAAVALSIVGAVYFGTDEDLDAALPWWIGAGGSLVAMFVGVGLAFTFDHADVRVVGPSRSR